MQFEKSSEKVTIHLNTIDSLSLVVFLFYISLTFRLKQQILGSIEGFA